MLRHLRRLRTLIALNGIGNGTQTTMAEMEIAYNHHVRAGEGHGL